MFVFVFVFVFHNVSLFSSHFFLIFIFIDAQISCVCVRESRSAITIQQKVCEKSKVSQW